MVVYLGIYLVTVPMLKLAAAMEKTLSASQDKQSRSDDSGLFSFYGFLLVELCLSTSVKYCLIALHSHSALLLSVLARNNLSAV